MGQVKQPKMQKPNLTPPKNPPRPVMLNPPAKKKTTGSGASMGRGDGTPLNKKPVMSTQKKPTVKKAVTPASTPTKRMQKPATKKQPVKGGRSSRGRSMRK